MSSAWGMGNPPRLVPPEVTLCPVWRQRLPDPWCRGPPTRRGGTGTAPVVIPGAVGGRVLPPQPRGNKGRIADGEGCLVSGVLGGTVPWGTRGGGRRTGTGGTE